MAPRVSKIQTEFDMRMKSYDKSFFPNIEVSTVSLPDGTYETAVLCKGGHYEPVERYDSQLEAIEGHNKYCKKYLSSNGV